MTTPFEEEYFSELMNIELGITETYRRQRELVDHDVIKVLEGLIRYYNASIKGKRMPTLNFSDEQQVLFDRIKLACETILGSGKFFGLPDEEFKEIIETRTPEGVVLCLKRILRSVNTHTKLHGRRGYLDFIVSFLGRSNRS